VFIHGIFNEGDGMKPLSWKNQRGAGLIIVVAMLLVLGVIGAVFVSLINNESFTAMNQSGGLTAFGVADGGMEFAQRSLAQNLDWYRSTADPIAIPATNLGSGSFTANTYLPATMLRNRIPTPGSTADIRVYTTDRFPVSGYIQIEDDITGSGEFVFYGGKTATTFTTGILRDQTIGGINGTAGSHDRGSRVYPVTTLVDTLLVLAGPPCVPTAAASFRIFAHSKFLTAGRIDIEDEEIDYTGSTTTLGTTTLNGVTRCANSTAGTTSHTGNAVFGVGAPVTPLLVEGTAPDFQAEAVSTGTVAVTITGNAVRVIRKTMQR
jgi:hypothetical protein